MSADQEVNAEVQRYFTEANETEEQKNADASAFYTTLPKDPEEADEVISKAEKIERWLEERKSRTTSIDEIIRMLQEAPQEYIGQILCLTPEQLNALPAEDYRRYLRTASRCDIDLVTYSLVNNIDIIAERFSRDVHELRDKPNRSLADLDMAHDICEETRFLLWGLSHHWNQLPPEVLEKFYEHINDDLSLVRQQATEYLDSLIIFDNRNREIGAQLDLLNRFRQDLIAKLTRPQFSYDPNTGYNMVECAWGQFGSGWLRDTFIEAVKEIHDEDGAKLVFSVFANRLTGGLGGAFNILNNEWVRLKKLLDEDPDGLQGESYLKNLGEFQLFHDKVKLIRSFFIDDKGVVYPPDELYNGPLDMGNWKSYDRTLDRDKNVLLGELPEAERILDIGCGAGLHIKMFEGTGAHVEGLDLVQANIDKARALNPGVTIQQGSWLKMPYKDKSFDAGYMAGRSIPHNITADMYRQFLIEAARVIKKTLIFTTQANDLGEVAKSTVDLQEKAEDMGIYYVEDGLYIGNPKEDVYADRMVLSKEEIKAIARLTGWKAQIIDAITYKDPTGAKTITYYWRLDKETEPLSQEEWLQTMAESPISLPPLFYSWATLDY